MQDTMPGEGLDDTPEALRVAVRAAFDDAWVDLGYTAPNTGTYPWLWLWDSCFHSLVWAELGEPDRALRELTAALSTQDPSGFVPHMGYQLDSERPVELWGRRGSSSITQPPMYGHAVAELTRSGVEVPHALVDQAVEGIRFLLLQRARDPSGLIRVVHPWETGCDDSPRWDHFCPGGGHHPDRWRAHKFHLLDTIERGPRGEPLDNPAFAVAPVGFNALVAWNAIEIATLTGDEQLRAGATDLAEALAGRWSADHRTWVDAGDSARSSGGVRTADALLPLLVCDTPSVRAAAVAELDHRDGFAGVYGPRGVHRAEPTYRPATYWRGPVWPQIAYLLWVAIGRDGNGTEAAVAERLRRATLMGARRSGLAEYWHPDTGSGLGAIPQGWAGLALLLDEAPTS